MGQPDADAAALELLERATREFAPTVQASSLGPEDMVITDIIARHCLPIEVFMIDTGRLHEETLELAETMRRRYPDLHFTSTFPRHEALETYVGTNGANAFYRSLELRRECCNIRKVEPLRRALSGKAAWITGQRREQSSTRHHIEELEWDEGHGLQKVNPLAPWDEDRVWSYLRRYKVPVNPLHDQGYPSIGCAPCTRAVVAGEDQRAGRWWWENSETRECGLHPQRRT